MMNTLVHLIPLATLFFSLANAQTISPDCKLPPEEDSKLYIIHVNSPCSPFRPKIPLSWEQNILQMQANDQARYSFLSMLQAGEPIDLNSVTYKPTYLVRAKNDNTTVLASVDSVSDLTWINACTYNVNVFTTPNFQAFLGTILASKLESFISKANLVHCRKVFDRTVGVSSNIDLSPDTLLQRRLFSYCLPSHTQDFDFSALMDMFIADLPGSFKGLVKIIEMRNAKRKQATETVFDTITAFSILTSERYAAVRDEIRKQMGNAKVKSIGIFDTCYDDIAINIEQGIKLELGHTEMMLPQENIIIRNPNNKTWCLAMTPAPTNSTLNVIGTFQQQNFRVQIETESKNFRQMVMLKQEICSGVGLAYRP